MTLKPKIKLFTCTVLFCFNCLTGFSAVTGPVIIDIPGFDSVTKSVFFARTAWGECNGQTELYTYRIDTDSFEIISDWCSRTESAKNRNEMQKK